jgi:hypothetical protein
MSGTEYDELKKDLQEVKELLGIIAKTVAADTEVAAVRTLRRLEEGRINEQIRQMSELAD